MSPQQARFVDMPVVESYSRVASGNGLPTCEGAGEPKSIDLNRVNWCAPVGAILLGASAGLLMAVCERRAIQIFGPQDDFGLAVYFLFLSGSVFGYLGWQWFAARLLAHSRRIVRGQYSAATVLLTMLAAVAGERLAPLASALTSTGAPLALNAARFIFVLLQQILPAAGLGVLLRQQIAMNTRSARAPLRAVLIIALAGLAFLVAAQLGSRCLLPAWGTLPAFVCALVGLFVLLVATVLVKANGTPVDMIWLASAAIVITGLNSGLGSGYSYGQQIQADTGGAPLFFEVGLRGDVRVMSGTAGKVLQLNGVDVGGADHLSAEAGLACFARFLRPGAGRVLVLGFGTGAASGLSLLFGRTEVVCAEEEPAVLDAETLFEDVNLRPRSSGQFKLLSLSARGVLRRTKGKFDLILVNDGDARLARTRDELTRQFYDTVKTRLGKGGLFASRLNLNSVSPAGLALVARTASASFAHCSLILCTSSECLLMASDSDILKPAAVGPDQLPLDLEPAVGSELRRYFGTSIARRLLATRMILDDHGIQKLGERDFETSVLSDWDLQPAGRLTDPIVPTVHNSLANELVVAAADVNSLKSTFTRCGCGSGDADLVHDLAMLFAQNHRFTQALDLVNWGLRLDSEQPDLLADQLIWTELEDPSQLATGVARIAQHSLTAANRVAKSLWERQKYQLAVQVYSDLTTIATNSPVLWCNLGLVYEAAGDKKRALDCLDRALSCDPINDVAARASRRLLERN